MCFTDHGRRWIDGDTRWEAGIIIMTHYYVTRRADSDRPVFRQSQRTNNGLSVHTGAGSRGAEGAAAPPTFSLGNCIVNTVFPHSWAKGMLFKVICCLRVMGSQLDLLGYMILFTICMALTLSTAS